MKKSLAFLLALIMLFSLGSTVLAEYLPAATKATTGVVVDGVVTEDEWGAPSYHGDKNTNWANNTQYGWDFWQVVEPNADESYDVWLNHDDQYVYVAVKLNNTFEKDVSCTTTGDFWKHAALAFTISAYDATTTVPRIYYEGQYYDQYSRWVIGLLNGTTKAQGTARAQGLDPASLADDEYEIGFDDGTNTYTYELKIPLSKTNVKPDSEGLVFSMDLHDPLQDRQDSTNRYLTCKVAQQSESNNLGPGNFMHSNSNPLIVFTGATATVGKVVNTAPEYKGVTIDGKITDDEWGEPVIITSPDHCQSTWGNYWSFSYDYRSPLQAAKVYLTNDADNVYIGFSMDHVNVNPNACTDGGNLWSNAHFGFSISAWDDTNTVKHTTFEGQDYEQYTKYMMGLVNGAPEARAQSQGIDPWTLPAENYAINYDSAAKTIYYEVKLPLSRTNINLEEAQDVAMSFSAACPFSSNLTDPGNSAANRYLITTGMCNSGGANNLAHKDQAIKFTLNKYLKPPVVEPDTWIDDTAAPYSGSIVLDGVVSEEEWGRAVVSTSITHTEAADNILTNWRYDSAAVYRDQNAKLYLTNDSDYLYIAATIDKCEFDECTDGLWQHANFGFSVSAWDDANTVQHTIFEGNEYEQYTAYLLGFLNGAAHASCETLGLNAWELPADDFAIKYDADAKTYTYEVKLPLNETNIDVYDDPVIALSGSIAQNKTTSSQPANIYHFGTGFASRSSSPGTTPHRGQALKFNLNKCERPAEPDTWISDKAASYSGSIVLDGKVTEDEWGRAVVSTSITHTEAADNILTNWRYDPAAVYRDQNARLYLTNDSEYIYVAATIDKCELDYCTSDLWMHANFAFSISAWDDANTVKHVMFEGDEYEQYTAFTIGFVDGKPHASSRTQGLDPWDLPAEDFAISFDEATGTYTYEARVPINRTNVDVYDDPVIALSGSIAQNMTVEGTAANIYQFGTGYASCGGANNFSHKGQALKFGLNKCERPPEPETWISDKAAPYSGSIVLDGVVSEDEWGRAVVSTSITHTDSPDNILVNWRYDSKAVYRQQNAKLYLTNDKENIYIAATIDMSDEDYCTSDLWMHANFAFSISAWDVENTVKHVMFEGNEYEQYTAFNIGFVDGKPHASSRTQGLDAWDLPAENFAIKYNEALKTYTYEVKVPLSKTNINLYNTGLDIALSGSIAQNMTVEGTPANIYQFGLGYANCGGPNNFAHKGQALKFTLNDTRKNIDVFVKDTAPATKGVKIDGVITEDEWGEAVISTTPAHCQELWGSFWQFDPSAVNQEQNVRIYMTNDYEFLYIGATIDECDFDASSTAETPLYMCAHFGFTISEYDEANTVKHIMFEGQEYEQFTGYMVGLRGGVKASSCMTQGIDPWTLPDDYYAISYNRQTRTYTYEIRIPFSQTNITSNLVALSISVGCPYTKGDGANRYNITVGMANCRGAGNFAHKGNALTMKLSTDHMKGGASNAPAAEQLTRYYPEGGEEPEAVEPLAPREREEIKVETLWQELIWGEGLRMIMIIVSIIIAIAAVGICLIVPLAGKQKKRKG